MKLLLNIYGTLLFLKMKFRKLALSMQKFINILLIEDNYGDACPVVFMLNDQDKPIYDLFITDTLICTFEKTNEFGIVLEGISLKQGAASWLCDIHNINYFKSKME